MTRVWFWFLTSLVQFMPITAALKADIVQAKIVTCSDCNQATYPEVLNFIIRDLPLFHNVESIEMAGKVPELLLIDKNSEEKESFRIDLLFREEIHDLLLALGFYSKSTPQEPVPEDFLTGPYIKNDEELDVFYELLDELIAEDDEEEEWRTQKK